MFPYEHEVIAFASQLRDAKELNRDSAQDSRTIYAVMSPYLNNERIHEMVDQDRSAIWSKRLDIFFSIIINYHLNILYL